MKYYQPLKITDPDAPYTNGNEITGEPGSHPDAKGFEATQREIVNVIKAASLIPSAEDNTQLNQAIAILSHKEADKIVRYQSLYQKMKAVENGVIILEDEKIINFCNVASAITLSLNLENVTKKTTNDIITFELYLNQTVASAITWFSGITWSNGEPPDLSEVHLYLFTFRSLDKGLTWQGGLQCFF